MCSCILKKYLVQLKMTKNLFCYFFIPYFIARFRIKTFLPCVSFLSLISYVVNMVNVVNFNLFFHIRDSFKKHFYCWNITYLLNMMKGLLMWTITLKLNTSTILTIWTILVYYIFYPCGLYPYFKGEFSVFIIGY